MEIKKLEQKDLEDFKSLIAIFKDVFENEEPISNEEQLMKLLSNTNFIVFVAMKEYQVIGGITIYILHRYIGSQPIAYIYDVGVSPEFQGKGVGKKLMAEVCLFCKSNGFSDAYVEAEMEDTDAIDFYRKTNYSSELNAIHFTYNLQ